MGHEICTHRFDYDTPRDSIQRDCDAHAVAITDWQNARERFRTTSILGKIPFYDLKLKGKREAEEWLDKHTDAPDAWYWQGAVSYEDKDGRLQWLVRYEVHV